MTSRSDRLLRVTAFALGAIAGAAVALFIYSNPGSQNLDWLGLHFSGVPVWSVGVVPLLVGMAIGYAYHLPARWYHSKQHTRYASLVAQLERENEELRARAAPPAPEPPPEGPSGAAATTGVETNDAPARSEAQPAPVPNA